MTSLKVYALTDCAGLTGPHNSELLAHRYLRIVTASLCRACSGAGATSTNVLYCTVEDTLGMWGARIRTLGLRTADGSTDLGLWPTAALIKSGTQLWRQKRLQ